MVRPNQTYLKFSALLSQSKVERRDAAEMFATSCTGFGGKNLRALWRSYRAKAND